MDRKQIKLIHELVISEDIRTRSALANKLIDSFNEKEESEIWQVKVPNFLKKS